VSTTSKTAKVQLIFKKQSTQQSKRRAGGGVKVKGKPREIKKLQKHSSGKCETCEGVKDSVHWRGTKVKGVRSLSESSLRFFTNRADEGRNMGWGKGGTREGTSAVI